MGIACTVLIPAQPTGDFGTRYRQMVSTPNDRECGQQRHVDADMPTAGCSNLVQLPHTPIDDRRMRVQVCALLNSNEMCTLLSS